MKFLVVVLVIRFVAELVGNKKDTAVTNETVVSNVKTFHPAEFGLR